MEIKLVSRPVLPDRIQVTVTPDLMSIYDYVDKKLVLKEWCSKYTDVFIENSKIKGFENNRFRDKHNRLCYIVKIPCDLGYVSNIRFNVFQPFSMSFKFNFIRYLRYIINNEIDTDYDINILLDEDNYISEKVWKSWDNNRVYDVLYGLNDIIVGIANKIINDFLPVVDIEYEKVTVNQIETNIDVDVGIQKSLFFMNLLSSFINSDKGKTFRCKVGEISLHHRIPFSLTNSPTEVDKNESVSIQFGICKGFFCKMYRKTRDHIRVELLFEKSYLQRKFRKVNPDVVSSSTNIKRIVKPVMEFSKDFFKALDFEDFLSSLVDAEQYNLVFNQLDPVYQHFRSTQPEINDIIDCLCNKMPITDLATIKFIARHGEHSKRFRREYNQYGRKFLVPDYSNVDKPRIRRLRPPYKSKRKNGQLLRPMPSEVVWIGDTMVVKKWR